MAVVYILSTLPTPLHAVYREAFGFSALTLTLTFVYAAYVVGTLATMLSAGRLSDQTVRYAETTSEGRSPGDSSFTRIAVPGQVRSQFLGVASGLGYRFGVQPARRRSHRRAAGWRPRRRCRRRFTGGEIAT